MLWLVHSRWLMKGMSGVWTCGGSHEVLLYLVYWCLWPDFFESFGVTRSPRSPGAQRMARGAKTLMPSPQWMFCRAHHSSLLAIVSSEFSNYLNKSGALYEAHQQTKSMRTEGHFVVEFFNTWSEVMRWKLCGDVWPNWRRKRRRRLRGSEVLGFLRGISKYFFSKSFPRFF